MTSETNPFATRYVRPGALPYFFPDGTSADAIVAQLAHSGWWGQIVGPHGSGKTALVESLIEPLRAAGRRLVRFSLHDGQSSLPPDRVRRPQWDATTLVIVDGYEQLGWLSRSRLKLHCRRREAGLLVTAHGDVGLPALWQTGVTEELAWEIVSRLTADRIPPGSRPIVSRTEVAEGFRRRAGDLRELLFDLYDLYEQRRE